MDFMSFFYNLGAMMQKGHRAQGARPKPGGSFSRIGNWKSKYMPHQGPREMARRIRQREEAKVNKHGRNYGASRSILRKAKALRRQANN